MNEITLNIAPGPKVTSSNERPSFIDPSQINWTPWVMEGTSFKLLAVDERSGGFTMILKVEPGVQSPIHRHTGAIEGIVLDGEFGYCNDRGSVGHYICEHGGAVHAPDTPVGTTMFVVVHGPLVGFEDDGSIAAVIDGKTMYELAEEAGQASHIRADFVG